MAETALIVFNLTTHAVAETNKPLCHRNSLPWSDLRRPIELYL